jgi:hypothetical protein
LTLKEDILSQKEDGRTWPKKEDMSSQRRTYGNPKLKAKFDFVNIQRVSQNSFFLKIQISSQI